MWRAFDPELRQQLDGLRRMVARQYLTPTKEWPLLFVPEHDVLFVVREWPNGEITAYAIPKSSHPS